MMPRTFVVPLDGSEFATRALAVARSFAWRVDGQVVAVSVAPEHGAKEAADRVRRAADASSNVPTELRLVDEGDPADVINAVAAETDDRIVCMTSHGRGGLRWAVLGSVAERVVSASDRPVLLVGRHCTDHVGNGPLLVCDDGTWAAEAIAGDALDWANAFGFGVEVAVVIHPLDAEDAAHPEALLAPIVERFERRGTAVQPTVLSSEYPAGAIADHAATINAAMVASAKRSKPAHRRIAFGSVTMGILNAAPCPLLVAHV